MKLILGPYDGLIVDVSRMGVIQKGLELILPIDSSDYHIRGDYAVYVGENTLTTPEAIKQKLGFKW